jgi:hypothetical protein
MSYIVNNTPNAFDFEKTQAFYNSVYDTLGTKIRDVDKTKELVLSNIYSYKKNKAQNKLLFVIIIMCIIIIIITYLNKKYNIIDDTVYVLLLGTILGFTFLYIGYSIWEFSFRDTINYDEFDYGKFGTINPETNINNKPPVYTSTIDASSCVVSSIKESDKTLSAFFKDL